MASLFQRNPAPTQVTRFAALAAHATSGSSALATTTAPGGNCSQALRQRCATWRTSLLRSSWSRLKLSNTSTAGPTLAATFGNHASSTSSTAVAPGSPAARAAAKPAGRLAPSRFVTTGRRPPAPIAHASSLVVVVFPFVPETSATCLPAESRSRAAGSITRIAWPPTTEPEPRPVALERAPRPPPATTARRVRNRKLMSRQATA